MAWDPTRDLRAWQQRLERVSNVPSDPWTPSIDVYETADRYVVTAEVPGLARDQIELALEDARLTLRGGRPGPRHEGEVLHYHQVERGRGGFSRAFDFPQKIDVASVRADLADGVLVITLPKAPVPPPRRIDVRQG